MDIKQIGEWEIDKYIDDSDYVIVDLREKEEYEFKHLKGAVNIPFEFFNSDIGEFDFGGKKIIVYCDRGGRSFSVAKKYGDILDIYALSGGIHSYRGKYMVRYMY